MNWTLTSSDANAQELSITSEALALLKRLVREEEERYEKAYRAASAHNNTDGVGIHFDYAAYPTHPEWFTLARDIIAKAKEGK